VGPGCPESTHTRFALSICPVKYVVTGMRIILGRTVEKGRKAPENQFYSGMSVYEIRQSPSIVLFPNFPTKPRMRIRPDPAFSNGRISHVSELVAFDAAQKIPGGNRGL
jgi:hypothetical protein